ncbi:MAG: DUF2185 domain-containing protein [Clostridia bacterium]|nr:DUF2185 domain-containing protein [Clostridia bacterium]
MTQNGFIDIEIKELLDWKGKGPDGCLVSDKITKEGWKVGYMYREEPDKGVPDSGWRFMKGDESDEYNAENVHIFALNTICNYDPDIIPYLDLPIGTALIRVGDHKFEEDNQDKEIVMEKQER